MQRTTSTPLNVLVQPPIEEIEKIEEKEKETAEIINQLVSAHHLKFSENDFKNNFNIFQNISEVRQRVRFLELHDIELDLKSENEIEDEVKIEKGILEQFELGRTIEIEKNHNSSIEQFLLENNLQRQNRIIMNKKEPQPKNSTKKANVSKQMTLDSQTSKQTENLSSPMRKFRRNTMKSEETSSIFKCTS